MPSPTAPVVAALVDDLMADVMARGRVLADTDPTLTEPLSTLPPDDREMFMAAVVVGIRYGAAGMIGELEARDWLKITARLAKDH